MSGFSSTTWQRFSGLICLVAAVVAFPTIPNRQYVGCMQDRFHGSIRTLGGGWMNVDFNTVDQCGAFCKYFKYFGVQAGTWCFCGNKLENNFPLVKSQCSVPCAGNALEKCGNAAINDVYSRTPAALPSPGTYKGCFQDPWINHVRQLSGYYQSFLGDMQYTPESCASICRGFRYYAMQASVHCFCGNKLNYPLMPVAESQCNSPCKDGRRRCGGGHRNSMYDRGANFQPFPTTHSLLGCYRWLNGGFYVFHTPHRLRRYDGQLNTMTPYGCQLFCEGFKYFGLWYGNQCMCSDVLVKINKVSIGLCNSPCSGDRTKACGGGGSYVTVYGRAATSPPTKAPAQRPFKQHSICTTFTGSWNQARRACRLAIILNRQQNLAAANACQDARGCWIGLQSNGGDGRFTHWWDLTQLTYKNFVGTPRRQTNKCVAITKTGRWRVERCSNVKPAICR